MTQRRTAKNEVSANRQQVSVSEYRHSGPIPDPMTLEGYNNIVPGAADRIIKMAEEQSSHRRALELVAIKSRSRDSLLGIIFGFLLALATIFAGTYVILEGFIWGGTILGSAGLVGLVSVFIYGTSSSRKERTSQ